MKKLIFVSAVILLSFFTISASNAALSDYGVDAFDAGYSAAALGMGGANTVIGGESAAILLNPAGDVGIGGIVLTCKDANNLSLIQTYPSGGTTFGLGLVAKGVSGLGPLTSYSNNFVIASYSLKYPMVTVGAAVKFLLSEGMTVGSAIKTGSGWDADLGIVSNPSPWLTLGASVVNALPQNTLGAGLNNWDSGLPESFSQYIKLGTGIKLTGSNSLTDNRNMGKILLAADFDAPLTSVRPGLAHLGCEWMADPAFSLRAGIGQKLNFSGQAESFFSFGLGTVFENWQIDLAYDPGPSETNSAVISATYFPFSEEEIKIKRNKYLNVFSPQENISVDDNQIVVSGEAQGYSLKINGVDVFVDSDHKFSVFVPLYVGKNLIEISGISDGQVIAVDRHVLKRISIVTKEMSKIEAEKSDVEKARGRLLEKELKIAKAESAGNLSEEEKKKLSDEKLDINKEMSVTEEKNKTIEQKEKTAEETKNSIENLAMLGVVKADSGQEYDSDARITRAELAVWIVKAKKLKVPEIAGSPFPDVSAAHWAAPYIKAVCDAGFMSAYPDGGFHPNDGVKQSEGIGILKKLDQSGRQQ